MNPAIEINIDELVFPPEETVVLRKIHKTVYQGDFISITGKPSSGKSMLLHAITGAAEKFFHGNLYGSVQVQGIEVKDIPLSSICEYMGYMMQSPQNQVVSTTVGEEVSFGLANMNLPWNEIQNRREEALKFVGLELMDNRSTDELSGGESQRVAFASIIAMKTPILILDQPGAELDANSRKEFYRYISHLNRIEGVTVVLVMDRAGDIIPYANRVWIMEKGTIIEECKAKDFKILLEKKTEGLEKRHELGEKILELKDLTFWYKGIYKGCEKISTTIKGGEFIALIGINGSGKSTLMKLIEGLIFPDNGLVEVFGKPMTKKNAPSLRKDMGFIFQDPDMQIFSSSVIHEVGFGLRTRQLDSQERELMVMEMLDMMGLKDLALEHPHKLSRSQRQKLTVASALITKPLILLADEPTSGLDDVESQQIMDIFSNYQHQGNTVILVTHDLDLVEKYASRILVLHKNQLAMDIMIDKLNANKQTLKKLGLDFGVEEEENV